MSKPRVITRANANAYTGPDERIVEFASDNGGGLISFRLTGGGRLQVSVYRCDPTVDVLVGQDDNGDPTPAYQNGRRLVSGPEEG